jgi:hypothetical protein
MLTERYQLNRIRIRQVVAAADPRNSLEKIGGVSDSLITV